MAPLGPETYQLLVKQQWRMKEEENGEERFSLLRGRTTQMKPNDSKEYAVSIGTKPKQVKAVPETKKRPKTRLLHTFN